MSFWRPIRSFAAVLAVLYFTTNCVLVHAAESNFWAERRRHTQGAGARDESRQARYNPAPSPAATAEILHGLPSVGASPFSSSLSNELRQSLPAGANKAYGDLFAALPFAYGTVRQFSLPARGRNTKNMVSGLAPSNHFLASPGSVVIHIQDVHQNAEAQANIGKTVQELIDRGVADMVALEGAFEPIDLSRFRAYPRRDTIRTVADYMLREHKISGPVHTAMTYHAAPPLSSPPHRGGDTGEVDIPPFVGVDDPTHYNANVEAYRESAGRMAADKKTWEAAVAALNAEKARVFSPALAAFDRAMQDYHAKRIGLGEHMGELAKHTKTLSPDVAQFLKALELERTLDFKQVERERKVLLERLVRGLAPDQVKALVDISTAYRLGRVRYADFYGHLKGICARQGVPLSDYPAMDAYVRYVLMSDGIHAERLMSAMGGMEREAYERLAVTGAEKALVEESRWLGFVGKLLDFSLTPEEWKDYQGIVTSRQTPATSHKLDLSTYESFYREAESRNAAMTDNLMNAMAKSGAKTAVLVTGGFHSQGMEALMRGKGAGFITFAPKISKVETAQGSESLSVFTREKTPLEKLFEGQKLFLAQHPASNPAQFLAVCLTNAVEALKSGVEQAKQFMAPLLPKIVKDISFMNIREGEADVVVTFKNPRQSSVKVHVKLSKDGSIESADEIEHKSWWATYPGEFIDTLQPMGEFLSMHANTSWEQVATRVRGIYGIQNYSKYATYAGAVSLVGFAFYGAVSFGILGAVMGLAGALVFTALSMLLFNIRRHVHHNAKYPWARLMAGSRSDDARMVLDFFKYDWARYMKIVETHRGSVPMKEYNEVWDNASSINSKFGKAIRKFADHVSRPESDDNMLEVANTWYGDIYEYLRSLGLLGVMGTEEGSMFFHIFKIVEKNTTYAVLNEKPIEFVGGRLSVQIGGKAAPARPIKGNSIVVLDLDEIDAVVKDIMAVVNGGEGRVLQGVSTPNQEALARQAFQGVPEVGIRDAVISKVRAKVLEELGLELSPTDESMSNALSAQSLPPEKEVARGQQRGLPARGATRRKGNPVEWLQRPFPEIFPEAGLTVTEWHGLSDPGFFDAGQKAYVISVRPETGCSHFVVIRSAEQDAVAMFAEPLTNDPMAIVRPRFFVRLQLTDHERAVANDLVDAAINKARPGNGSDRLLREPAPYRVKLADDYDWPAPGLGSGLEKPVIKKEGHSAASGQARAGSPNIWLHHTNNADILPTGDMGVHEWKSTKETFGEGNIAFIFPVHERTGCSRFVVVCESGSNKVVAMYAEPLDMVSAEPGADVFLVPVPLADENEAREAGGLLEAALAASRKANILWASMKNPVPLKVVIDENYDWTNSQRKEPFRNRVADQKDKSLRGGVYFGKQGDSPDDLTDEEQEIVITAITKAIKRLKEKHPELLMAAHGSYYKKRAKINSDIDVMVTRRGGISFYEFGLLETELRGLFIEELGVYSSFAPKIDFTTVSRKSEAKFIQTAYSLGLLPSDDFLIPPDESPLDSMGSALSGYKLGEGKTTLLENHALFGKGSRVLIIPLLESVGSRHLVVVLMGDKVFAYAEPFNGLGPAKFLRSIVLDKTSREELLYIIGMQKDNIDKGVTIKDWAENIYLEQATEEHILWAQTRRAEYFKEGEGRVPCRVKTGMNSMEREVFEKIVRGELVHPGLPRVLYVDDRRVVFEDADPALNGVSPEEAIEYLKGKGYVFVDRDTSLDADEQAKMGGSSGLALSDFLGQPGSPRKPQKPSPSAATKLPTAISRPAWLDEEFPALPEVDYAQMTTSEEPAMEAMEREAADWFRARVDNTGGLFDTSKDIDPLVDPLQNGQSVGYRIHLDPEASNYEFNDIIIINDNGVFFAYVSIGHDRVQKRFGVGAGEGYIGGSMGDVIFPLPISSAVCESLLTSAMQSRKINEYRLNNPLGWLASPVPEMNEEGLRSFAEVWPLLPILLAGVQHAHPDYSTQLPVKTLIMRRDAIFHIVRSFQANPIFWQGVSWEFKELALVHEISHSLFSGIGKGNWERLSSYFSGRYKNILLNIGRNYPKEADLLTAFVSSEFAPDWFAALIGGPEMWARLDQWGYVKGTAFHPVYEDIDVAMEVGLLPRWMDPRKILSPALDPNDPISPDYYEIIYALLRGEDSAALRRGGNPDAPAPAARPDSAPADIASLFVPDEQLVRQLAEYDGALPVPDWVAPTVEELTGFEFVRTRENLFSPGSRSLVFVLRDPKGQLWDMHLDPGGLGVLQDFVVKIHQTREKQAFLRERLPEEVFGSRSFVLIRAAQGSLGQYLWDELLSRIAEENQIEGSHNPISGQASLALKHLEGVLQLPNQDDVSVKNMVEMARTALLAELSRQENLAPYITNDIHGAQALVDFARHPPQMRKDPIAAEQDALLGFVRDRLDQAEAALKNSTARELAPLRRILDDAEFILSFLRVGPFQYLQANVELLNKRLLEIRSQLEKKRQAIAQRDPASFEAQPEEEKIPFSARAKERWDRILVKAYEIWMRAQNAWNGTRDVLRRAREWIQGHQARLLVWGSLVVTLLPAIGGMFFFGAAEAAMGGFVTVLLFISMTYILPAGKNEAHWIKTVSNILRLFVTPLLSIALLVGVFGVSAGTMLAIWSAWFLLAGAIAAVKAFINSALGELTGDAIGAARKVLTVGSRPLGWLFSVLGHVFKLMGTALVQMLERENLRIGFEQREKAEAEARRELVERVRELSDHVVKAERSAAKVQTDSGNLLRSIEETEGAIARAEDSINGYVDIAEREMRAAQEMMKMGELMAQKALANAEARLEELAVLRREIEILHERARLLPEEAQAQMARRSALLVARIQEAVNHAAEIESKLTEAGAEGKRIGDQIRARMELILHRALDEAAEADRENQALLEELAQIKPGERVAAPLRALEAIAQSEVKDQAAFEKAVNQLIESGDTIALDAAVLERKAIEIVARMLIELDEQNLLADRNQRAADAAIGRARKAVGMTHKLSGKLNRDVIKAVTGQVKKLQDMERLFLPIEEAAAEAALLAEKAGEYSLEPEWIARAQEYKSRLALAAEKARVALEASRAREEEFESGWGETVAQLETVLDKQRKNLLAAEAAVEEFRKTKEVNAGLFLTAQKKAQAEKLQFELIRQDIATALASMKRELAEHKRVTRDQSYTILEQARIMREKINEFVKAFNIELKAVADIVHFGSDQLNRRQKKQLAERARERQKLLDEKVRKGQVSFSVRINVGVKAESGPADAGQAAADAAVQQVIQRAEELGFSVTPRIRQPDVVILKVPVQSDEVDPITAKKFPDMMDQLQHQIDDLKERPDPAAEAAAAAKAALKERLAGIPITWLPDATKDQTRPAHAPAPVKIQPVEKVLFGNQLIKERADLTRPIEGVDKLAGTLAKMKPYLQPSDGPGMDELLAKALAQAKIQRDIAFPGSEAPWVNKGEFDRDSDDDGEKEPVDAVAAGTIGRDALDLQKAFKGRPPLPKPLPRNTPNRGGEKNGLVSAARIQPSSFLGIATRNFWAGFIGFAVDAVVFILIVTPLTPASKIVALAGISIAHVIVEWIVARREGESYNGRQMLGSFGFHVFTLFPYAFIQTPAFNDPFTLIAVGWHSFWDIIAMRKWTAAPKPSAAFLRQAVPPPFGLGVPSWAPVMAMNPLGSGALLFGIVPAIAAFASLTTFDKYMLLTIVYGVVAGFSIVGLTKSQSFFGKLGWGALFLYSVVSAAVNGLAWIWAAIKMDFSGGAILQGLAMNPLNLSLTAGSWSGLGFGALGSMATMFQAPVQLIGSLGASAGFPMLLVALVCFVVIAILVLAVAVFRSMVARGSNQSMEDNAAEVKLAALKKTRADHHDALRQDAATEALRVKALEELPDAWMKLEKLSKYLQGLYLEQIVYYKSSIRISPFTIASLLQDITKAEIRWNSMSQRVLKLEEQAQAPRREGLVGDTRHLRVLAQDEFDFERFKDRGVRRISDERARRFLLSASLVIAAAILFALLMFLGLGGAFLEWWDIFFRYGGPSTLFAPSGPMMQAGGWGMLFLPLVGRRFAGKTMGEAISPIAKTAQGGRRTRIIFLTLVSFLSLGVIGAAPSPFGPDALNIQPAIQFLNLWFLGTGPYWVSALASASIGLLLAAAIVKILTKGTKLLSFAFKTVMWTYVLSIAAELLLPPAQVPDMWAIVAIALFIALIPKEVTKMIKELNKGLSPVWPVLIVTGLLIYGFQALGPMMVVILIGLVGFGLVILVIVKGSSSSNGWYGCLFIMAILLCGAALVAALFYQFSGGLNSFGSAAGAIEAALIPVARWVQNGLASFTAAGPAFVPAGPMMQAGFGLPGHLGFDLSSLLYLAIPVVLTLKQIFIFVINDNDFPFESLSDDELEMCRLITAGFSDKNIASKLGLTSKEIVRVTLHRKIYPRLGVYTRNGLAAKYKEWDMKRKAANQDAEEGFSGVMWIGLGAFSAGGVAKLLIHSNTPLLALSSAGWIPVICGGLFILGFLLWGLWLRFRPIKQSTFNQVQDAAIQWVDDGEQTEIAMMAAKAAKKHKGIDSAWSDEAKAALEASRGLEKDSRRKLVDTVIRSSPPAAQRKSDLQSWAYLFGVLLFVAAIIGFIALTFWLLGSSLSAPFAPAAFNNGLIMMDIGKGAAPGLSSMALMLFLPLRKLDLRRVMVSMLAPAAEVLSAETILADMGDAQTYGLENLDADFLVVVEERVRALDRKVAAGRTAPNAEDIHRDPKSQGEFLRALSALVSEAVRSRTAGSAAKFDGMGDFVKFLLPMAKIIPVPNLKDGIPASLEKAARISPNVPFILTVPAGEEIPVNPDWPSNVMVVPADAFSDMGDGKTRFTLAALEAVLKVRPVISLQGMEFQVLADFSHVVVDKAGCDLLKNASLIPLDVFRFIASKEFDLLYKAALYYAQQA